MQSGFYATDKMLRKEYLLTGKPSQDLFIALKQYFEREKDGGVNVEEVTIYAVDVASREILGNLGKIATFMKNDRINWDMLSKFNLQKGSYIKYKKLLNWENVSQNENLSMEMIEFLGDNIDKSLIKSHFERFNDDYLLNHLREFDMNHLILDKKLPVIILQELNSNEKDFYIENGVVDLDGFKYILGESIFKGQVYRDIMLNPNADKEVFIQYADKLDWSINKDVLSHTALNEDEFWHIYPYAKNTGVLETCDLSELVNILFYQPLDDFDYETYILNNKIPKSVLEKSRVWLDKLYSKNKIDALCMLNS